MTESLESRIGKAPSAYEMLYNSGGHPFGFPVAPEFTNWRDEQRAWKQAAIFQDMSHHMCNVYFEGPDCYRLFSDLAINSFAGFGPMQAKQFVCCNPDGQYIGDAILTCEAENSVMVVGKPPAANWAQYHAETGGYDVKVTLYDRPGPVLAERSCYRFQVQGPNADKIFEEANGGPLPEIGFFKMGRFKVGAHTVTALNHRMSGAPGFEIWGPAEEGPAVRATLLAAGAGYGMRQIGGRTYPVTATESGWIGSAIPAVYSGAAMKPFRDWLGAASFEGVGSTGGSYPAKTIEDLYLTPYEMGYGFMIKFDHEFIGRAALERIKDQPKRKKVRLRWNGDDAARIYASNLRPGERFKTMEMPVANYATFLVDAVRKNGALVGMSFYPVYSENTREWISLGVVDESLAKDGEQLDLTWGEPGGGSGKVSVERHQQTLVRVTVDSKPIKRD